MLFISTSISSLATKFSALPSHLSFPFYLHHLSRASSATAAVGCTLKANTDIHIHSQADRIRDQERNTQTHAQSDRHTIIIIRMMIVMEGTGRRAGSSQSICIIISPDLSLFLGLHCLNLLLLLLQPLPPPSAATLYHLLPSLLRLLLPSLLAVSCAPQQFMRSEERRAREEREKMMREQMRPCLLFAIFFLFFFSSSSSPASSPASSRAISLPPSFPSPPDLP